MKFQEVLNSIILIQDAMIDAEETILDYIDNRSQEMELADVQNLEGLEAVLRNMQEELDRRISTLD